MRNQENKKKPSHHDVMPAIAKFVNDSYFEIGDLNEFQDEVQEIAERLFETEHADELHIRLKTLKVLKFIRDFHKSLKPFSRDIVILETNKLIHA